MKPKTKNNSPKTWVQIPSKPKSKTRVSSLGVSSRLVKDMGNSQVVKPDTQEQELSISKFASAPEFKSKMKNKWSDKDLEEAHEAGQKQERERILGIIERLYNFRERYYLEYKELKSKIKEQEE